MTTLTPLTATARFCAPALRATPARRAIRRFSAWLIPFALVGLLASAASPAWAVVVATTTGNTTPPPDAQLWEYVGQRAADSAVYLGGGWAIASFHTGPGPITLPSGTYPLVAGSEVRLKNPTGQGLSEFTDLVMFRLATDPGLPPLEIAEVPPPIGGGVLMIGRGRNRSVDEVAWNVDTSTSPPTWTVTTPPGDARGFTTTSNQPMRWGTNIIEDDDPLFGESDPDHNRIYITNSAFGHVVGLVTIFDELGGTSFEAQAVSGDSGGAVYYDNGTNWVLAGILDAALGFQGQPDPKLNAVFGNGALMADLSIYHDQILAIRGPIVPEPSSLALAILGLAGAAAWSLRRPTSRRS